MAIWFDTRQVDNPKYLDATAFERPSPIKKRSNKNKNSAHLDTEYSSTPESSRKSSEKSKKSKKGKKHSAESVENPLERLERDTVVYDDLDHVEEPFPTPSPTLKSHVIKVFAENVPDDSVKVVLQENGKDENNNLTEYENNENADESENPDNSEVARAVREEMKQIEAEDQDLENEIEIQAARSMVEGDFPDCESELDTLEEVPPHDSESSAPFPKLIPLSPSAQPVRPIRDLEAKVRQAREYKAKWQQSEDKWLMELRGTEVAVWRERYQNTVASLEKERALRQEWQEACHRARTQLSLVSSQVQELETKVEELSKAQEKKPTSNPDPRYEQFLKMMACFNPPTSEV